MLTVLEVVGGVILVLLSVVLVHEGGHYLMAKVFGVRVDEFSVGFGPRLAKRQRGETTYSLRAIPAGGYVKMAGMLGLEGEADAGARNFYRASIPKRLIIILAGIVINFIFGALLYSIVFALPTGGTVVPGGAAQVAGLRDGDVITAIDGRSVRHDNQANVTNDLHAATAAAQGRTMSVTYSRGGAEHTATFRPTLIIVNGSDAAVGSTATPSPAASPAVTSPPSGAASPSSSLGAPTVVVPPRAELVVSGVNGAPVPTGDPSAVLGAGPVTLSGFIIKGDGSRGASYTNALFSGVADGTRRLQPAWRLGVVASYDGEPAPLALRDGFGQIPTFVGGTFTGLADLVTKPSTGGITGPQGLSGPVGIVRETATQTQQGPRAFLTWVAFISLNLGLVNVLPIPFLDGGKAFLLLLEAVRRRRLDPRVEALTYAVGLGLVVLFVIYVTIGDVSRPQ